jgi:phosphoserine phosphatase RsbX
MEMTVLSIVSDAPPALVECGLSTRPLPGEKESGDLHVLAPLPNGLLIGVVDGLGHGAEAAHAARVAVRSIQQGAQLSITDLVHHCHTALKATRGVVMSLATIDANVDQMTWVGVGNVEATLVRNQPDAPRQALVSRSGVVGYQLPPLRPTTLPITPGDLLVFATDGINSEFYGERLLDYSPQQAADYVIARYANPIDDALILVARYAGLPS